MWMSKAKTVVGLVLVALAGVGVGTMTMGVVAQQPPAAERSERVQSRVNTEGLTTVAAYVVAVSPDGKRVTLEIPAQARGEDATRTEIQITDKTEIGYDGVGLNGAKPTVGYHAQVWLSKEAADRAAKVSFSVVDATRQSRSFVSGKVAGVSEGGKSITIETPAARDQETRKLDFKLTGNTKVTFAYVKDAKPAIGQQADIWLEQNSVDTAEKAHFVDSVREQEAIVAGKVISVAKDSNILTLEVPSRVRGESPVRIDVKMTEVIFHRIGPDEANLREGYFARLWLQEGSADTATKAVLFGGRIANERGR
jgi:hypothetical protein